MQRIGKGSLSAISMAQPILRHEQSLLYASLRPTAESLLHYRFLARRAAMACISLPMLDWLMPICMAR